MFRELASYCVTNSASSASYSSSMLHSVTKTHLFISVWSGNDSNPEYIGTGQRVILIPRKILTLIASLINLFEIPSPCVSFNGVDEKLSVCVTFTVFGQHRPGLVLLKTLARRVRTVLGSHNCHDC